MKTKTKEEIKAWLGFNLQDALITIGAIPFAIGMFLNNIIYVSILFAFSTVAMAAGMYIYFAYKNTKISKLSEAINKWSSLVLVVLFFILMVVKYYFLLR